MKVLNAKTSLPNPEPLVFLKNVAATTITSKSHLEKENNKLANHKSSRSRRKSGRGEVFFSVWGSLPAESPIFCFQPSAFLVGL